MDTRWRSSVSEMMDIWLPAKGNWMLGSIGGITTADELAVFLLGAISILPASRVGGEWQRGFESGKARTRARKAKAAKSAALMGYSRVRYRFKSAQSSPGGYFQNPSMPRGNPAVISRTPVRHLITRASSSKSESPNSSDGGVGSRLRLLFLPMVEAEGKEEREAAEEQRRMWKSQRDNDVIYRRRRQPLTSNRGH
jgi:hypothetical protein